LSKNELFLEQQSKIDTLTEIDLFYFLDYFDKQIIFLLLSLIISPLDSPELFTVNIILQLLWEIKKLCKLKILYLFHS